MTPVEKGAYCKSCCKTVIDFTGMSDNEIIHNLYKKQDGASCGRFRNDQLNRPILFISPEVLQMNIPAWKKYLAILFICFSGMISGCGTDVPYGADLPVPDPPLQIQIKPGNAAGLMMKKETETAVKNIPGEKNDFPKGETMVAVSGNFIQTPDYVYGTYSGCSIIEQIFGPPKK